MNSIQKEKIAHEKHLLSQGVDFKYLPNIQYNELENVYELIEWDEEYSEALNEINSSWCTWQAAKAQAVPKWISVEDKLPELKEHTWRTALPVNVMIDGYGQYLCYPCQDGNGVFYWADATYYGNDKGEHPIKCDRDTEVLNVTHWMPLPDAPQEPAND